MNVENMQIIKSELAKDHYYQIKHSSGLQIFLYPQHQYQSSYAIFATKYGSIDTTFKRSDENDLCKVPEGIAHFLEHKLFENEDCDAFERYAKTGASANAYTSFDMTAYLFSCTENFYDSLEILLDFVQSPYFTTKTVQKEQGIIEQEIKMYEDSPHWQVFFNLLTALFQKHPVKIDIAGTVESISKITPELLYRCYNTFYNLNNMALCAVGNIAVDKVLAIVDKKIKASPPLAIDRVFEPEQESVCQKYIEQKLSVSVPLLQLGFKEIGRKKRPSEKEMAETAIWLEAMTSSSSPLYRRLLDEGLINDSFSSVYFEVEGCACIIFSGESKNPYAVAEEIKKELVLLNKNGVDREAFNRTKKAIYARYIAFLNSAESIANHLINFYFAKRELYSFMDELANVSLEDSWKRMKKQIQIDNHSLSVILPK